MLILKKQYIYLELTAEQNFFIKTLLICQIDETDGKREFLSLYFL